jgi:DNA-binding transcriptional LysR family regulator
LATEKYLSLSRLLREPQVVSHPELFLILSEFAEPGESVRKSRHSVSVGGPAMLLEMVAAGLGVGIALLTQVEMIRRLDVVVRPFERSALQVSTYAIVREDPRSEAPERFLARAHAIG